MERERKMTWKKVSQPIDPIAQCAIDTEARFMRLVTVLILKGILNEKNIDDIMELEE